MWKNEEHEGKNYSIIDDYMINKVLDKIKEIIGTKQCDNIKLFIDKSDKLPDGITLKRLWY